jgi:mannose-1-phosphate guanylyltransferase
MNTHNLNYFAVIMAGGVGSRFWPVSKANFPKQFHDMMGVGETLIQLTYNRIATIVPPQNILILTNEAYKDLVMEQLPGVKEEQIVLEPAMRNTAPCILLAALKIKKQNPDAVMLVAPSDHWIEDKEAFVYNINTAFEIASKEESLITLGIKPTSPNTGFGYIKFDEEEAAADIKKVAKFTEKPTLRNAKKYLAEGNYLWNAGIFIWKAAVIAEAFAEYQQEMFQIFNKGIDKLNTGKEDAFVKETYPEAQNISIDYAILEKSNKVYVIPADFDWNDLGTWGALYTQLGKDDNKNVVVNAHLLPRESGKNIIYTHSHKVVVLDGLEDYIVVDDKDVLLIVPREKEQEIKEIRTQVLEKYGNNLE